MTHPAKIVYCDEYFWYKVFEVVHHVSSNFRIVLDNDILGSSAQDSAIFASDDLICSTKTVVAVFVFVIFSVPGNSNRRRHRCDVGESLDAGSSTIGMLYRPVVADKRPGGHVGCRSSSWSER